MIRLANYVAGKWIGAADGKLAVTLDPADQRTALAEHPLSGAVDVDRAVAAARGALPRWRAMAAPARGRILARAAAGISSQMEDLARTLTLDEGKTLQESRGEIGRAAEALEFCAGETRRLSGETLPSEARGRWVMTVREPLGVVGAITPWNYPAQIAAWKIGPALAMGNTVVFKPSGLAPWISQRMVEILAEALEQEGAPAGTLNLVHGAGALAGSEISAHVGVDGISFTGSAAAGRAVQLAAAQRGAAVLCEMGGKNPLVVLDDADLDLAAAACVRGAFGNAGQRCTATSRVIVTESIAPEFSHRVTEATRALRLGAGIDPATEVGPMVCEANVEAVNAAVAAAVAAGAKVLAGGHRDETPAHKHGCFYLPTVLAGVDPASPIAQEEVFGPVVVLLTARDDEDALALANGVRYGLSASVCTRDLRRALRFAHEFEAGIVHVNSPTVGGETHVPFGGWKATGTGGRERGGAAIDFFTRWKTIYLDGQ